MTRRLDIEVYRPQLRQGLRAFEEKAQQIRKVLGQKEAPEAELKLLLDVIEKLLLATHGS